MVNTVLDLVSAPWVLYTTILVLLTVDAFIPVVPAQALMIGGGVLTATGHVELVLLVASGAGGALLGDMLAFLLGRRLARRDTTGAERLNRRKPRAITLRLNEAMRTHIFLAVLLCRFVPAGRMITAMYAGRSGLPIRRFAGYDAVAATIWATYAALLGYFGGEALTESSWLPIALVGLAGVAFLAGAPLFNLASRLRRRSTAAPLTRRPAVRRCRTAMETLAAAEPMAAFEVLAAAEAVAAAESMVVAAAGLHAAA